MLVGQVAESADLLAVALSGGCGLLAALDVVASVVGGRAGHELRVVAAAVRWGVPPSEAWRLVSPGWRDVAAAFVVAERAGVPPSGLLGEAARAMRHAEAQAAGERAGVLSARLALPLGLTFLPGFVLTTIVPVVLGMASTLTR
ncbi:MULTISPECIES: type II secretion system F family protein [Arsenicicoccus]|uniref:Type II secretion system F family protein n=1 Tax=Arsenicicoccus bolidensis TaxID=229480 RepID=A0ABS9PZK2_9MICO|nr:MULTISPECIES: type II secretion system F family protein [Arsenicicoccus]MCG7320949.1 type II secretion system F family protein [Arsenicicoccus bolidensis]